ncbi:Beta-ketoadipate enol-lactone hydrolase [Enhygromyxa salina]|uniref:Beta-ketoadipate enol-lactone hydrolase n=1 Tax=Enhygromyxa salina TaxID=215803 RepID=A0A0C2CVP8_9BACT|nr:alpha/beta fold hydrolase [Enhygromyxa salina]KIG11957.1 Beta-ketoadipate enol-lactone hydrolase [Enhygromyxa salina]
MSALESRIISTSRLDTHLWLAGAPGKPAILLLHGNVSSAVFFDRVQAALGERYFVIAPDLRGYGRSQVKPVDATRGVRDFSDDLAALLGSPELGLAADAKVHVVAWSAGGNVAMQLAIDHGARVASLTLINPGSPYGFGGTKGADGTPCYDDFAGSGAGGVNPTLVELLVAKDTGADQPVSPRNVMNTFYWKPPFKPEPETEERYLAGMLEIAIGEHNYPGDALPSANWPNVAPGVAGMNNALSPKYLNQSEIVHLRDKPPILWVRGADDQIVSDRSMFDFGVLGELGAVPGWPGAEVFPAQPMVEQTRAVFDRYAAAGGAYTEVVIADAGHGPHIEKYDEFMVALNGFLAK